MFVVEIENLTHVYGKSKSSCFKALNSISLKIEKGQHIGIVGETGSGKSTLVKIIGGILKPTSGEVSICGSSIFKNFEEVRERVGFVFQNSEYALFEETVAKDIAFGLKNLNYPKEIIEEKVKGAANLVGLRDELLLKSPFELSGGEKKRVAIAGVLAMEPEILILDEPTVGLDPNIRRKMLEFFDYYRKEKDCTIIHVTHDIDEILKYADKILMLKNGEVFGFCGVEEVFEKIDEFESLGLKIPQLPSVFLNLKKKGLDVPINVKTAGQGLEIVKNLISKR